MVQKFFLIKLMLYRWDTLSNFEIYIESIYFIVATVLTVGYGDITARNTGEKILVVFLMLSGVLVFSCGIGALTSIISNYDSNQKELREKLRALLLMK
jgi:voltage-gated potassium channel Kch